MRFVKFGRFLVSGWALIPCVLLMVAGYVLAGLMAMAAEDLDREPTGLENTLILIGFMPMYWFAAIMIRLSWKSWQRRQAGERETKEGM